jgi:hypothetical protein
MVPSFGDVKSAASSPQPQTKPVTGTPPTQNTGTPVQGLSAAGKSQNLNIAKSLSAPAAERQESSGSKPITVQKVPVAGQWLKRKIDICCIIQWFRETILFHRISL